MLLGIKCVFQHQNLQFLCPKLNKHRTSIFHTLEVVGYVRETQVQVSEN